MKELFKKILSILREIHRGTSGKISWVRTASSIIILTILINYSARTILGINTDFGLHEFYVIAGCMGFKVAQRFKEASDTTQEPTEKEKKKKKENKELDNPDNV